MMNNLNELYDAILVGKLEDAVKVTKIAVEEGMTNSLHNPSVERIVIFYPLAQFLDFCRRSVSVEVLLDEYFEIFLIHLFLYLV